ncbi:MAG: hypothetical protein UX09_C0022G0005 [Candidatus Uhrbacteria bacterium GW2011_GWE2_45_35]|uniref:Uncharacterized protein n=2 Tax=Candidatus Uhriibacteriota TaxID=1752732 RepID=A0A0G1JJ54_9BACT|nr:MAG: hypothetical protein UW63_C0016G0005 [Candidatus Uhrbacteria bacterium GW2011_GWF2_44_350]KKU07923.1 MAG: hypothetical protein UX09_C0022G0005 [Candidatus Uhrbacteria bacterium GW2011_GWE2_45_35]HBR80411.1 hypothetical protein [Candidatus Uhrbacteria bacterium]HCU32020.1 hypothetical protein [Candidatus Uhrbacteria bacterium]
MIPAAKPFVIHSAFEWLDQRVLRRLPNWGLWAILVAITVLFGLDIVVIDPVPLVDEALLGILTYKVMAELNRRREQRKVVEATRHQAIEASPEA